MTTLRTTHSTSSECCSMNDIARQQKTTITPAIAALLGVFHEHTAEKLAIAPVDSVTLCHCADGITEVDEDGWCTDYDDMDEHDAIDILPTGVVNRENP
ncbi:hypothetical protein [Nocardia sp. CA-120079]|uniref:hypothetical protein n=1 Tax=Nocardia sp. CA-120079 TaxID=3239974 RepID=UPI003D99A6E2